MKILKYPESMPEGDTDFISFGHQTYRTNSSGRPGIGKSPPSGTPGKGDAPSEYNTIRLYMPNSTPAVGNGNDWGDVSFSGPIGKGMQALGDGAVNASTSITSGKSAREIGRDLGKQVADVGSGVTGESVTGMMKQGVIEAAGQVIPGFKSGNNLLAFSQGKIYNPNVELLYQGPKLRSFSFSFNFICRSIRESNTVDAIIREFKMYSAADDQGDMLEVPHIWKVNYMMGGIHHPKMNKFKNAALLSVSVQDNVSSNMHTTFEDGTPSVTSIVLAFQEVDVIFRKDHEEAMKVGYLRGY